MKDVRDRQHELAITPPMPDGSVGERPQAYSRPRLRRLGSVRDLTLGVSGLGKDFGGKKT